MYRVFLLVLHVILLGTSCDAKKNHLCTPSSCGEICNISFPFRLKGDPKDCGLSKYELACENNRTVLYMYSGRYYVKSIYYDRNSAKDFSGVITVVDDGLKKGNCSSLPRYSLALTNFSYNDPYHLSESQVVFVKCSLPVASIWYVDTKPCIEEAYSADTPPIFSQTKAYSYVVLPFDASNIMDSCTITMITPTVIPYDISFGDQYYPVRGSYKDVPKRRLYKDLHNGMAEGFNLSYLGPFRFVRTYKFCFLGFRYGKKGCDHYYSSNSTWSIKVNVALNAATNLASVLGHFLAAKFIFGAPCVLMLLIYKWIRRHQAMDANIEEFLQAHNNFLPIRYSYSDIKKITKNFKHKLGEGGYGSVYKGTLRSGNEVAIKILKKSKSDGQDFISEVSTIGRIHHVNVVQLVGFCIDYSKQALVYDFMPNGSLDKYICYKDGDNSLDYKKMFEISIGIARGVEYLHRGCDMQILHFDIKPHNVLLDRNFTPKVSDFGLARLYPTGHNTVTLTAARGTLGYMAPELFYKDIGGVSFKADVYSFGMMLMEMAGRRRNINAHAERSSQVYFPMWIYDQLEKETEVEMVNVIEEERETMRKMIIVALWCIQLSPSDRPSMRKVLDMLEGDMEKLQLPPKPLLYPMETIVDHDDDEIELETVSPSSRVPIISNNQFEFDNELSKLGIV